jgi:deoxyribodipyrimidine photolyase-related protein
MHDKNTIAMSIGILFPHQLFEQNILMENCTTIYLIEEYLFFKQYNFHQQKIAFHRASMKFYEHYLQSKNIEVVYIDAFHELADIRKLLPYLKSIKHVLLLNI